MAKSNSIWTAFESSLLLSGIEEAGQIALLWAVIMNDTSPLLGKRRALITFILCFSFALLLAFVAAWFLIAPRGLIVRGEIEATRVDLAVNVAGYVRDRNVRIGDKVRRGDQLLTLANPALEAKLVQAMAASNVAEVEMQQLLIETRTENPEQQLKTWKRAREISEAAQRDFDRTKQMQLGQKFEDSQRGYNARQASAREPEGAVTDNRQEKRDLAVARATQAKAVVLELKKNLEELNVIAPVDGEVAQIHIDRGELAKPGAVLISIVDLSEVWLTADLREDLLASFRMHESLKGKVPALGEKEVEFEIKSLFPLENFAKGATKNHSDIGLRIFKLRAVPTQRIEGLRPGMSVLFELPSSSSKIFK